MLDNLGKPKYNQIKDLGNPKFGRTYIPILSMIF